MTQLRLAELRDYTCFVPGDAGGDVLFDLTGAVISGARVVQEWVVREWVAERGSLPWAPQRGVGLLRWENASLSAADLARRRQMLTTGARSVDFVHSRTDVALRVERRVMFINCDLWLVDGGRYPFAVTLDEAAQLFARFT